MDVILGDNELIEAAMQKSPQRIRNIAINQADTIRPAKNTNAEWDHICAVIEDNIDFRKTVSECIIDRHESDDTDDEKTNRTEDLTVDFIQMKTHLFLNSSN